MENYEIRIVRTGQAPVILAGPQVSDFAAIRRAKSLAGDDAEVEVWRDMDCLYAQKPGQSRDDRTVL